MFLAQMVDMYKAVFIICEGCTWWQFYSKKTINELTKPKQQQQF